MLHHALLRLPYSMSRNIFRRPWHGGCCDKSSENNCDRPPGRLCLTALLGCHQRNWTTIEGFLGEYLKLRAWAACRPIPWILTLSRQSSVRSIRSLGGFLPSTDDHRNLFRIHFENVEMGNYQIFEPLSLLPQRFLLPCASPVDQSVRRSRRMHRFRAEKLSIGRCFLLNRAAVSNLWVHVSLR